MRCPTCRKEVSERIKGVWPFCSKRCKMIDLGKWAKEEYRIEGKTSEDAAAAAEGQTKHDSEEDWEIS